ncbi:MAG: hypothetical protein KAT34_15425 [Candidatus Aminicenantes bacterium]|nr:hypothetical protein [Candidatus Aminicenantes bacterium]
MWSFQNKKEYYEKLLNEVETILSKNGVMPTSLFKNPKVLHYLTYYPFNHIYCFLAQEVMNKYINEQEKKFARFIIKLARIRQKSINLLLDTPSDYEYDYPSCVGWKDNPKYEEEVKNYRSRLTEYEDQKKITGAKRKKLLETPEARVYFYVKEEDNKTKCPTCFGSGRIPSISRKPGSTCGKCRGSGRTAYLPKVTPGQRRTAKVFKKKWDNIQDPNFTFFPRKKKSIYIRVVHGGQIFIVEK